mgnify:CR=1 FL=1
MKKINLIKVSALLVLALVFGFVFTGVNVSAHTDCEDCAAVDQATVEQALEDAYELLETYGPQAVAQFEDEVNAFFADEDVQATIGTIAQIAKNIYDHLAGTTISALNQISNAIEIEISKVDGQEYDYLIDVYVYVEEVNAAVAALEEAYAPFVEALVGLYAHLKENDFYVEEVLAYVENATNGVVTIANALEVVEHAGHLLSTQVDYINEVVNNYYEEIVNGANDLHNQVIAEIEAINAEVEAFLADLEANIVATVEETVAAIEAKIAEILFAIEVAYEAATTGSYVTTEDSYYVALGDSTAEGASYVDVLAANLFLNEDMYANLAVKGMRVEDLAYMLTGAAGDEYYVENFAELAEDYIAAIEAADLITLGFNNIDFVSAQLGELVPYALDWNQYFDVEVVAEVEKLFAELDDELTCALGEFKSTVLTLVSSYVYNYYGTLYHYYTVVKGLQAINPEAVVVSLGMYNVFQGLIVEVDGTQIPVGDIIDSIIEVIDQYHVVSGMVNDYTVSVSINGVETEYDAIVAANELEAGVVELLSQFITNPDVFLPSEAGHEEIAATIYNTLFHTCAHVAEEEDGDCTTAVSCVLCGEILVEAAEEHTLVVIPAVESTCAKAGSTEGSYCSVCDMVIVEPEATPLKDHEFDNTCDNSCNNCLAKNPKYEGHKYDNNCDEECNVCHGIRRTLGHVFGEWTVSKEATKKEQGQEYRECIHCGEIEIRSTAKLPTNNTAVIVVTSSVVGAGGAGFAGYWFIFRKRGLKISK